MNDDYSQAGQDEFVLNLLKDDKQHYFFDVGCWLPKRLNNTLLLEENGWGGISLDITDLTSEWKTRTSKFLTTNALTCNYQEIFDEYSSPKIIDYLSLDIEGNGERFLALKKVFESDREFKIITIEHDSYRGYELTEAKPQREFLLERGYILLCSNVKLSGNPFEDWWINPNFFGEDEYIHLQSDNVEYIEILKKFKI